MRIGILTGGGDVPGLNPCIKAVVNQAEANDWAVLGIRKGWAGLLHYNPADTGVAGRMGRAADGARCPDHRPLRRHASAHIENQPTEGATG